MTYELITYLLLGAAAGGFINGFAGTGTALFALGFYLAVLPPISAVAIVAFMSILTGLRGLWVVQSAIWANLARLFRFLLPGVAGVPIGLIVLDLINVEILRFWIAILLVMHGGYFSFSATLPTFGRRTPWVDAMIGFVGGVLGGAASVSGAIPAIWLSLRPWPKAETRAVLQPFNVVILSTTVILLMSKGAFDAKSLSALIVTIPTGLTAAQIGIAVFKRVRDNMFRRLLIILNLLMGLELLANELF
ncbi:MAG: sulfite exporter TauE/SafE family protein [Paracoccaceae bacterium]|nr:sulfite exporter TauE/SafE family protein [Paracoccaceae bacterium]